MSSVIHTSRDQISDKAIIEKKINEQNTKAWAIRRSDLDSAFRLSSEAYSLAESIEFKLGIAHSLSNLARIYHYQTRNDLALGHVLEALALFDSVSEIAGIFVTPFLAGYHTLGMVYGELGGYSDALETYIHLLQLSQDHQQKDFQIVAMNGIAVSYSRNADYAKARQYYEQCLELCRPIKNRYMEGACNQNIATDSQKQGNLDDALAFAHKALVIFDEIGELDQKPGIKIVIGETLIDMGDYPNAIVHLQEALEGAESITQYGQKLKVDALHALGRCYGEMGQYSVALSHLKESQDLATLSQNLEQLYVGHELLAKTYKAQGDFEHALEHFESFHEIKEAVFSQESKNRVDNLMVLHQTETVRHEARVYRLQNEVLERLRAQDRSYYENMSRMKDDLLHTTSHDLKNPLTTILLATYMARAKAEDFGLDLELEEHFVSIEQQVELMRDFIRDLLDLASAEMQSLPNSEMVAIGDFVRRLVSAQQPTAQQKSIELDYLSPPKDIVIPIDRTGMARVIHNLLSNAIKYTAGKGRVVVTVEQVRGNVKITVSDNGLGIPAVDLPHIFEKFYRVQTKEHEQIEGTGIGLAIVKRIIEQHSGRISVTSEIGSGTTFTFYLPLVPSDFSGDA